MGWGALTAGLGGKGGGRAESPSGHAISGRRSREKSSGRSKAASGGSTNMHYSCTSARVNFRKGIAGSSGHSVPVLQDPSLANEPRHVSLSDPRHGRSSQSPGELSEWFKEHAWKACIGASLSGVRIPHSPPKNCAPKGALFLAESGGFESQNGWQVGQAGHARRVRRSGAAGCPCQPIVRPERPEAAEGMWGGDRFGAGG